MLEALLKIFSDPCTPCGFKNSNGILKICDSMWLQEFKWDDDTHTRSFIVIFNQM